MLLWRLLLASMCALLLAAPAAAQDPQVDPDSPAGREYELPIDRAREQAGAGSSRPSGAGGSDVGGASDAPLFGAGVEPEKPTSGSARSGSARSGTAGDPATTAGVEPDAQATAQASALESVRAQAPAPDGGGSALVAIGAGGGGVLLLGGLAGLTWRRRTVKP